MNCTRNKGSEAPGQSSRFAIRFLRSKVSFLTGCSFLGTFESWKLLLLKPDKGTGIGNVIQTNFALHVRHKKNIQKARA
jgi:hypothetical protein